MPNPALWLGKPFLIMGIVNCTPDSFSDGGCFFCPQEATAKALQLCEEGADIIDLGGESTRPGAPRVSSQEEWRRLQPVILELRKILPAGVGLSVDTRKPEIMFNAAQMGVNFINNVEGLAPLSVLKVLSGFSGLQYIAMHMHGTPEGMQKQPLKGQEALKVVESFFEQSFETLTEAGFLPEGVWMDPGIGFGKDDQANLLLMKHTPLFVKKYKMVLGVSRKSWLGRCLDIPEPLQRDAPSKVAEVALAMAGAGMIRTHAVKHLARFRDILHKPDK